MTTILVSPHLKVNELSSRSNNFRSALWASTQALPPGLPILWRIEVACFPALFASSMSLSQRCARYVYDWPRSDRAFVRGNGFVLLDAFANSGHPAALHKNRCACFCLRSTFSRRLAVQARPLLSPRRAKGRLTHSSRRGSRFAPRIFVFCAVGSAAQRYILSDCER